jgi:hypothetical protein
MGRKFRPLDESIMIVSKMIVMVDYTGEADETYVDDRGQKSTVMDYWTKRLHGYQKLKGQFGKQPQVSPK